MSDDDHETQDEYEARCEEYNFSEATRMSLDLASERAAREKAEQERDEARAINDVVICAWCGWQEERTSVEETVDRVAEHTETCAKRPEVRLRMERDRALVAGALAVHAEREALAWIAQQFCDRTNDADKRVCPESGDCLTEWCLSCYAGAHLATLKADGVRDVRTALFPLVAAGSSMRASTHPGGLTVEDCEAVVDRLLPGIATHLSPLDPTAGLEAFARSVIVACALTGCVWCQRAWPVEDRGGGLYHWRPRAPTGDDEHHLCNGAPICALDPDDLVRRWMEGDRG